MIDQIKAEIERLIKQTELRRGEASADGARETLYWLKDFIESLEKELPTIHPCEVCSVGIKNNGQAHQGLDEAAEESMQELEKKLTHVQFDEITANWLKYMFKAGAKWMAGQGGYFEDTVFLFQNHPMLSGVAVDCVSALEKAGAKSGDKVIIQIRKK